MEKCSNPFRLSRVNGLAVKSNTAAPLERDRKNKQTKKNLLSCHISRFAAIAIVRSLGWNNRIWMLAFLCRISLEKQAVDMKTSQSFFISTAVTWHKNLHFRAPVKFRMLVILFVMKYEWEIHPNVTFLVDYHLYLSLCVINKHFEAPSCQRTEQMCHAATDCINLPSLPHLICLICTG